MNITKISLGTVQFGVDYGINSTSGQVKSSEVINILNYAQQCGINLLDTAPAYGNSEKALGDANIKGFNIVTKTRHFSQTVITNKEMDKLSGDLDQSLQTLKQKSLYGLLVHNADDLFKIGADKIINQLQAFKQQGLISNIGVSIYTGDQLQKIIDRFDIDLVQLPFNILDKRLLDSGVLDKIHNRGIEVHARSVFLQGLLLMTEQSRPRKFNRWKDLWKLWHEWLSDNKLTALEAAIRYAISTPEISRVLVGVDSKDQLQDIIKAADGDIPPIPKELFTHDTDLLNPENWYKL
jgi:aryl-alcohol dehydrogenase-like predicted oxidoreductase